MYSLLNLDDHTVMVEPKRESEGARGMNEHHVVAQEYVNMGIGEPAQMYASDFFEPQPGPSTRPSMVNEKNAHLREFVQQNKNKHTARKTGYGVKKFKTWLLETYNIECNPEQIERPDLDVFIGEWLMQLKKPDGDLYEPDSILSFHRCIARHLKDQGYKYNIVNDDIFVTSRDVLQTIRKQLKSKGKGNKPNRAEPLDQNVIKKLWDSGQLGLHSAKSLLNTMWYFNTELFGFRGGDENRQLRWGDVDLVKEVGDDGHEELTLQCNERLTKMRADGEDVRAYPPTLYENKANPGRCPIQAYLLYRENRPACMLDKDSPFYLQINHSKDPKATWFKAQAVGHNPLGKMMKTMVSEIGIQNKRYTNHSLRKTGITELVDAGFDPVSVSSFSGHKNPASISHYAQITKKRRRDMQSVLVEKATGGNNVQPSASTLSAPPPTNTILPSRTPPAANTAFQPQPSTSHAAPPPPLSATNTGQNHVYFPPTASTSHAPPAPPATHTMPSRTDQPEPANTASFIHSQSQISSLPTVRGLFSGCSITGGTFHITVNTGHAVLNKMTNVEDAGETEETGEHGE